MTTFLNIQGKIDLKTRRDKASAEIASSSFKLVNQQKINQQELS